MLSHYIVRQRGANAGIPTAKLIRCPEDGQLLLRHLITSWCGVCVIMEKFGDVASLRNVWMVTSSEKRVKVSEEIVRSERSG